MFSATRHAKRISFLCFIAFVLMLGVNYESLKQLHEHRYFIYEQDAYMHLVLAHDFLQNPNLHEHFNYRTNTPWGSDTHGWTNLVTLLLAGGALALKLLALRVFALNCIFSCHARGESKKPCSI